MCLRIDLHVCICTTCVPVICGGQTRTLELLELELQMFVSHRSWELTLDPLEDQLVFLTAEPSLSLFPFCLYPPFGFLEHLPPCNRFNKSLGWPQTYLVGEHDFEFLILLHPSPEC